MLSRTAMLSPVVLVPIVLLLVGCSSPPANEGRVDVASGRYEAAVDASRDVLQDLGFEIDRVDAAGGVVSSAGKRTAGIATPWDGEQSHARQEWEDLINRQSRRVRVVFAPKTDHEIDPALGDWSRADLRDADAAGVALQGRVEAVIYRFHRAHRRLQSEAIRFSTFTEDPIMNRRHGMRYEVARERDGKLERRIAAKINERMRSLSSAAEGSGSPPAADRGPGPGGTLASGSRSEDGAGPSAQR